MRLSKLALSTASLPLHEQGIRFGSDAHSDHSSRADNSQGVEEQILRSRRQHRATPVSSTNPKTRWQPLHRQSRTCYFSLDRIVDKDCKAGWRVRDDIDLRFRRPISSFEASDNGGTKESTGKGRG